MASGWERYPAIAALGTVLALASCAVASPAGPSVVAVPPQGKDLAVFQQEDAQCRTYASAAMGGKTAPASSQRYDILYTNACTRMETAFWERGASVRDTRPERP